MKDVLNRAVSLVHLATTHRAEIADRFVKAYEILDGKLRRPSRLAEEAVGLEWVAALIMKNWSCRSSEILAEPEFLGIQNHVDSAMRSTALARPFDSACNSDLVLGKLCYLFCRAMKPNTVIETGVAYGNTTAFILTALEKNRQGRLCSIDLPPLGEGAPDMVGAHVPIGIRSRWELHRGSSRRLLPALLRQLGSVELFIHDSLHTYLNMKREFESAAPFLKRGGLIIADDVEQNTAFQDWASSAASAWAVLKEENKSSRCGVAVL